MIALSEAMTLLGMQQTLESRVKEATEMTTAVDVGGLCTPVPPLTPRCAYKTDSATTIWRLIGH